jgi:outer membrane protein assembly factor BamB
VCAADDWNCANGGNPARHGRSTELGPTAPTILWQTGRPAIIAQEGVCEGNVLVVPRWSDFGSGGFIVGYNLTTGVEMWAKQLPVTTAGAGNNRPTGMRDGRVYCTRSGNDKVEYLYALDAQTGNQAWVSQDLITESYTESIAFTSDGDIIASKWVTTNPGTNELLRIRKSDGTTMWRANRTVPSSDGLGATVFGNTVYIWEAAASGPKITAFDATTGARKYSSASVSAGLVQQGLLMVGPDGTVYAPRFQNNVVTDFFVAYTDTGSGFTERWRVPMGYTPFGSHAIGADGSVYTYETTPVAGSTTNLTIKRRDPMTGAETGASLPIVCDYPADPRMSVDAAGRMFLTNGSFGNGRLYSLNADLSERWNVAVPNVNTSGPIIGQGGIVVVCGVGTDVRAFKTENAQPCYANCDASTIAPILNVNDFTCFLNRFAAGESLANCDASTVAPVLNVNDFTCFLNRYAVGCT